MWREAKMSYRWGLKNARRLDIGLVFRKSQRDLCGEKPDDSSTRYPQENRFFNPIHILETFEPAAHIWGYDPSEKAGSVESCPQQEPLIHKLSRVIHKSWLQKAWVGVFPTPYI
jgi:hypothetical protein